MKSFLRSLSAGLAALVLLASFSAPAFSAVALLVQTGVPIEKLIAYGDVTAAYTNATTSYTDLTGSSFTYTPSINDCTTAGRVLNTGRTFPCLIKIQWSFDVIKATTTTGTCTPYVNGALVTAAARSVDVAAKQTTIAGILVVANTVAGAQTIKFQCKSGDTATFTVNTGHVVVTEIRPN